MTTEPQSPPKIDPDPAPAVGLQSRIRAALKDVADDVASKSRVVIAVPGKEISEAMYRIFSDVPHVPDYDPETAGARTYSSVVEYASDEVPADPIDLKVSALADDGDPRVFVEVVDTDCQVDVSLDLQVAEEFFLAGLAAVAHARATRDRPTPVD